VTWRCADVRISFKSGPRARTSARRVSTICRGRRRYAGFLQVVFDQWLQIIGATLRGRHPDVRAVANPELEVGQVGRCAEDSASDLCSGKCGLSTRGDRTRLILSDKRQNPKRKPIGKRHIACDEINAGLLKSKEEVSVTGDPVEFGNDEGSVMPATGLQRRRELREADEADARAAEEI
jgi:hypothetical protein